jgi:hypothetical protein
VIERVIEGGLYRKILAINCLKWQNLVSRGGVKISPDDDPYVPLAKFLTTGAPVNRAHRFVDVGKSVFELSPGLYRASEKFQTALLASGAVPLPLWVL